MSEEDQGPQASADPLNEDQERTTQDPQVEVTHPDSFARKQYESDTPDPNAQGQGNNPTEAQGGVGKQGSDYDESELDPSHQ